MAGERVVQPAGALVPSLRGNIVDPRSVRGGEIQDVERMAILLVCVRRGVGNIRVLLDLPFDRMGRNAGAVVAVGPVDDAFTAGVGA